jgi:hypothetical protein
MSNIRLYDVHGLFGGKPVFLLRAPLETIRQLFSLHPEAVRRIHLDTAEGKSCELFRNQRRNVAWGAFTELHSVTVTRTDHIILS